MFFYGIDNSKTRTELDKEQITVKFKSVYPDFTSWKTSLLSFGVTENEIKETDFNLLMGMIGNAYMKFTTDSKVKTYVAVKFLQLNYIKNKDHVLYGKTLDDILSTESINEQALYTIGRRLDTGLIEADYIDNKVVSKLKSTEPIINRMKEIIKFNNTTPPDLMFLIRLANAILLPLQPNQKGDTY